MRFWKRWKRSLSKRLPWAAPPAAAGPAPVLTDPAPAPAPPPPPLPPAAVFHAHFYLRHNARRLEHLASLGIPVRGCRVLEVGAGIGDHSHYFLDRGCRVTITEGRAENLEILRRRYPGEDVRLLDLEAPGAFPGGPFEVVHCYGLLYHLSRPQEALDFLAAQCSGLLLLETCVSFGDGEAVHPVAEDRDNPSQAVSGTGCRPTRPWLLARLRERFPHVYVPATQPNHEEFPVDWQRPEEHRHPLKRAVFVASRTPLALPALLTHLPARQERHA